MRVDITAIKENLASYAAVLSGNSDTTTYIVSKHRAKELKNKLKDEILSIGNNYKNGTEVCPYMGLGQELGQDGYVAIRNLRMKKYDKWIIVFIVNEEETQIRIIKLVYQGYPVGKSLKRRRGDGLGYHFEGKQSKNPIQECWLWMVKLGCFNQYQVESLKERGIL